MTSQTRYFVFGYFKRGASARKVPPVEYADDSWRGAVDAALDELRNDLPELADELEALYNDVPRNWRKEASDSFTYYIEEISKDQFRFRRIEGLDLADAEEERELDEYIGSGEAP